LKEIDFCILKLDVFWRIHLTFMLLKVKDYKLNFIFDK